MLIAIDQIDHNPAPLRRFDPARISPGFVASIANQGVLQPILVRQEGNRYVVVKGDRRLAAAREAGLAQVPVHVENACVGPHAVAANAAATLARKPLLMVEQFRALARLQDEGLPPSQAAVALGLDDERARQMERLGRLHPDLLEALGKTEQDEPRALPPWRELGVVASAAPEEQLRAARAAGFPDAYDWYVIADILRKNRLHIPRAWAIFPADQIAWQEDMFIPADNPQRFTAADPVEFLARQTEALAALAAKSKGRLQVVEPDSALGRLIASSYSTGNAGWRIDFQGTGKPEKLAKTDGRTVFAIVVPTGHSAGLVRWAIAVERVGSTPAEAAADDDSTTQWENAQDDAEDLPETGHPSTADDADEDDAEEDAPAAEAEPAADLPLTKHGRALLAGAHTQALRAALRDPNTRFATDDLLALLLLALAANTVTVKAGHNAYDSTVDMRPLAKPLLSADGALAHDAPGVNLERQAREALARMLCFPRPDDRCRGYGYEPCPIATAIARIVEADNHLPRLDTPEFLATVSGDALKAHAKANGLKLSKVSTIREAMANTQPEFRPAWALLNPTPAQEG